MVTPYHLRDRLMMYGSNDDVLIVPGPPAGNGNSAQSFFAAGSLMPMKPVATLSELAQQKRGMFL
ncbi:hypothetical protein [Devosia nitrariae]|uniref:hypothetical protein n=1 Tax=Devosia nitrariae TaxID=2071872 RepID=UPI0024E04882|nr:hypothetical protein [Devosia nitrariae]